MTILLGRTYLNRKIKTYLFAAVFHKRGEALRGNQVEATSYWNRVFSWCVVAQQYAVQNQWEQQRSCSVQISTCSTPRNVFRTAMNIYFPHWVSEVQIIMQKCKEDKKNVFPPFYVTHVSQSNTVLRIRFHSSTHSEFAYMWLAKQDKPVISLSIRAVPIEVPVLTPVSVLFHWAIYTIKIK